MSREAKDVLTLATAGLLVLLLFAIPPEGPAVLIALAATGLLFISMTLRDAPSPEPADRFAAFLRALEEPRSWGELLSAFPQSTLQNYVNRARKLGLIQKRERDGKWVLTPAGADYVASSTFGRLIKRVTLALRASL